VKALTEFKPSIGQSFPWKTLLLPMRGFIKCGSLEQASKKAIKQAFKQALKCQRAVKWTHSDGVIGKTAKTPGGNNRFRSISSRQSSVLSTVPSDDRPRPSVRNICRTDGAVPRPSVPSSPAEDGRSAVIHRHRPTSGGYY